MCVIAESSCSIRKPHETISPKTAGFIKAAINQRLIKRLGHSWGDCAMAENQQNITEAITHVGGSILRCSQMVAADRCIP